nr:aldehyde dehydrogenase family protein [Acetobacter conturbans]
MLKPLCEENGIPVYGLYVDGRWVASTQGKRAPDHNPADNTLIAYVHQATAPDVEAALESAQRASRAWADTRVGTKEALFFCLRDVIMTRRTEIQQILIKESGSAFKKALWEIDYVIDLIQTMVGEIRRIAGETMPTTIEGRVSMSFRQPLGVVLGICPFNSPFLLTMKKVVPAVAAGNAIIIKPSEETPLSGLLIADLFEEAGLPPGVLNVINAAVADIAPALTEDPRIKAITFTGSTRTGRLLAEGAARGLKRITLEMGGKGPLVVLRDADLDGAVRAATFGAFLHQGQVCMAGSRVIVDSSLYDEFCKRFVERTRQVKVGSPDREDTVVGPLIRISQCAFIAGQIEDAVSQGAVVRCGGGYNGSYFEPTVLTDVTPAMRIYHEESFGPVVSVLRAEDTGDALRLANDTSYGLSAAVMTENLSDAWYFAQNIEAGMVHINDSTISDEPHVPFGGVKNSGFGREGGRYSIEEMTELKWVTFQTAKPSFPF